MDWVDELIARLEASKDGEIAVEISGQVLVAKFTPDLTKFFKDNQALLLRVGKETFRSFIVLLHEKKNSEAFNLLLAKMSADDIIARINQNSDALQQQNELNEKLMKALETWFIRTLAPHALKVLLGMLL
jgi:hypothetical protein